MPSNIDWQFMLTAITAISSAIAAGAAAWSARATHETAKEMEQARLAETRPLVLVTSRLGDRKISLVLKNFGGPATKVSLQFRDQVPWAHGEDIREAPLFNRPIPLVAPSEEYSITMAFWPDYWFTQGRDAAGAPVPTGWSRNPVGFRYELSYTDPFTNHQYSEPGHLSINHFAPTAEQGGLRTTTDPDP